MALSHCGAAGSWRMKTLWPFVSVFGFVLVCRLALSMSRGVSNRTVSAIVNISVHYLAGMDDSFAVVSTHRWLQAAMFRCRLAQRRLCRMVENASSGTPNRVSEASRAMKLPALAESSLVVAWSRDGAVCRQTGVGWLSSMATSATTRR